MVSRFSRVLTDRRERVTLIPAVAAIALLAATALPAAAATATGNALGTDEQKAVWPEIALGPLRSRRGVGVFGRWPSEL